MQIRIWAATAAAAIGWGTGGVATRAALNDGISPIALVAIRAVIAAAMIVFVMLATRRPWQTAVANLRLGSALAVLNLVAPFVLYTFAYRYASAGFVGILIALVPIGTASLAHFALPDEPLHMSKVVGLFVAFSGVAFLLVSGNSGLADGGRPLIAAGLAVAGVVSIGFANVYAKGHAATYDAIALMAVQFVLGAVILVIVALVAEGVPTSISMWGWVLIVYMALGATVLPYMLYYWMLRHVSTTRASMIGYFVPPVSLLAGAIFLSEKLQIGIIGGGVIILIGVLAADRAERMQSQRAMDVPSRQG